MEFYKHIFCHPEEFDEESLLQFLMLDGLIDWQKQSCFGGVEKKIAKNLILDQNTAMCNVTIVLQSELHTVIFSHIFMKFV